MDDFNTAHHEIDLARPKGNREASGFMQVERDELDRWLEGHFVDTFRHLHGDVTGRYSWWSQRIGLRERNVGWRIDYVLASKEAIAFVDKAQVCRDCGARNTRIDFFTAKDAIEKELRNRGPPIQVDLPGIAA